MSLPPIVVDASAAIALIRREPDWPAIAEVLRGSAMEVVRLLAPEAFWLEVVNVLVRRHGLPPSEVVEALRALDDLGIDSVRIDRPLLLVTIDLQARFGLSAYDAAYLAVAEIEDARLLTLDRQLARAAGARAVPLPGSSPERLSEAPVSYGEPIDWARFGPYLAELRAAARDLPRVGALPSPNGSTSSARTISDGVPGRAGRARRDRAR